MRRNGAMRGLPTVCRTGQQGGETRSVRLEGRGSRHEYDGDVDDIITVEASILAPGRFARVPLLC